MPQQETPKYRDMPDSHKLARWQAFQPRTPEEQGWKRRAIRQFSQRAGD